MEADEDSDFETNYLRDGLITVKFPRELKSRIRSPWSKALIVKVYGRSVGKEFFLVRFSTKEDCEAVLRNGPWFIGENFLSIRPWEPNFKPAEANISSVQFGIGHRRDNCPYVVQHEATQAKESDGDNGMMVDREHMAHAVDSPGMKASTSKDEGKCEDTSCEDKLEDNPKDMYGPWVMVTRKQNGNKVTKKGDHSEQHTLKKQEATIFGVNELPLREGKRKAMANYSPNEAQMAKAVQSIANGAKGLGLNSGKVHNEAESPKEILSPSVRGKKGIAKNRASSSSDKNLVVKPAGLESPIPIMASFLDNRDFNPNPSFNFKATSSGQLVGKGLEEGQMAKQIDMEM
nr:hypothetical protein CFP56_58550 [Quercus suber]